MKRLKNYFPNYLVSVLLTLSIIAASSLFIVSKYMLDPSFCISSIEKHNVYQYSSDYAKDYFEKSYGASNIPPEIYMDGLDEKIIKQAVDGKVNAFFDYISGKTDEIKEPEVDFSQLEQNISDYFDKFAAEKNVEINDLFKEQLDKTIKTAESDIISFTNVFMLDYMEKVGATKSLRKIYPYAEPAMYVFMVLSLVCAVTLVLLNKKELKSFLYWLSVSGICASLITLAPCIMIKYTDYFSRLVLRTDYIYFAVTGYLNDSVNTLFKSQCIVLAVSVLIMLIYAAVSAMTGKKKSE